MGMLKFGIGKITEKIDGETTEGKKIVAAIIEKNKIEKVEKVAQK